MVLFSVLTILRFVAEALQKMKGKIPEIAGSHISSRVLQVSFGIQFAMGMNLKLLFLFEEASTYSVSFTTDLC